MWDSLKNFDSSPRFLSKNWGLISFGEDSVKVKKLQKPPRYKHGGFFLDKILINDSAWKGIFLDIDNGFSNIGNTFINGPI